MCRNNITSFKNCYGCGVCVSSCPKQIIELRLNSKGFYEPIIKLNELCIECGICLDICSYNNDKIAVGDSSPVACYATWSNDLEVRQACSSGGIGYEIARHLMQNGYKVVGVRYDVQTNRAEHYIAEKIDELQSSIGSKYIQSYPVDAFRKINKRGRYLVTGTPCQIDSFRRYIRKVRREDNFVLMDFFCHGVPSMFLWKKYSDDVKKITGKIISVLWRNKTNGWHDSYDMIIQGKKGKLSSRWSQGDLFFKMFLSNCCLGKACYNHCKFKGVSSSADIRIGDLWGKTYSKDDKGVSGVVVFTERGYNILQKLECTLVCHSYDVVTEGQLHEKLRQPLIHGIVCKMLNSFLHLKTIFYFVQLTRLPYLLKCKLKKLKRR